MREARAEEAADRTDPDDRYLHARGYPAVESGSPNA
jgi:hypothetical protein